MLSKYEFIEKTLQQVRWKKAHESVKKELSDHIDDQKNAFMRQDLPEDEAAERAVLEMGDPVEVGTLLDASYRPKSIGFAAVCTAVMIILGLLINRAAGGHTASTPMSAAVLVIMLPVAFCLPFVLDISLIYKYGGQSYIAYMLLIILFGLYGVTGLNVSSNYIILLFPVLYGPILCSMRGNGIKGLVISQIAMMAVLALSTVSGSVRISAFVLFTLAVCIIMNVYGAVRGWFGNKITAAAISLMPIVIVLFYMLLSRYSHYFIGRISTLFMPESDPNGGGFCTMATREYLKNSVFMGKGYETAVQLPNAHTDFALTQLIHNFGYIALAAVSAVAVLFLTAVFVIVKRQKSELAKITGCGIFFTFLLNTLWYFAANLGIVGYINSCPPFLFGGGTAMVINTIFMGVLASISRNGSIISDRPVEDRRKNFSIEWLKNKIIIHIGDED